jgi:hypothetical protein
LLFQQAVGEDDFEGRSGRLPRTPPDGLRLAMPVLVLPWAPFWRLPFLAPNG